MNDVAENYGVCVGRGGIPSLSWEWLKQVDSPAELKADHPHFKDNQCVVDAEDALAHACRLMVSEDDFIDLAKRFRVAAEYPPMTQEREEDLRAFLACVNLMTLANRIPREND